MGHLNLVKCLIEKHYCDPTSKDDNEATSLHITARKGQLSVLQYFIDTLKCSPICYDLADNTPIHVAAIYEIVKYLIECSMEMAIVCQYLNEHLNEHLVMIRLK